MHQIDKIVVQLWTDPFIITQNPHTISIIWLIKGDSFEGQNIYKTIIKFLGHNGSGNRIVYINLDEDWSYDEIINEFKLRYDYDPFNQSIRLEYDALSQLIKDAIEMEYL